MEVNGRWSGRVLPTSNRRIKEHHMKPFLPHLHNEPDDHQYVPFTEDEWAILQQAIHDAARLCMGVREVLSEFNRGASTDKQRAERKKIGKLLFAAFRICSDGAADPVRVTRLHHIDEGIPHNLSGATYHNLKRAPKGDHVAETGPGRSIDVTPLFLEPQKRSNRAVVLIHEAIHMLQNAEGFTKPRDKKYNPHHNVLFEKAVYYPYHHQMFVCHLFHIPDPSTRNLHHDFSGTEITVHGQ
jgi:hypothetical protein